MANFCRWENQGRARCWIFTRVREDWDLERAQKLQSDHFDRALNYSRTQDNKIYKLLNATPCIANECR